MATDAINMMEIKGSNKERDGSSNDSTIFMKLKLTNTMSMIK